MNPIAANEISWRSKKQFITAIQNSNKKKMQSQHKIIDHILYLEFKKTIIPFYGRGSTASRLEPLQEGSLLYLNLYLIQNNQNNVNFMRIIISATSRRVLLLF